MAVVAVIKVIIKAFVRCLTLHKFSLVRFHCTQFLTEWGDSESEMTIGPGVHAPVRILALPLLLCQDSGKSLHLQEPLSPQLENGDEQGSSLNKAAKRPRM